MHSAGLSAAACLMSALGNGGALPPQPQLTPDGGLQATADAAAACTSKVSGGGKAQGCAISEAAAYAYEVAFAAAHATAAADAFTEYCSCNNAAAWAFADADLFLVLIADVFSQASSTACAAGAHTRRCRRRHASACMRTPCADCR